MKQARWLAAAFVAAAAASSPVAAQEPATVTGRVTNAQGAAENAVTVRINTLNVGTTTATDGTYRLVIPASRLRSGQQVTITASRQGLASSSRTITLNPGASLSQNFQLGAAAVGLEGLVVTALGITREERAVSTSVQSVQGEELTQARETNIVNALSGKVSGVTVTNAGPQGGSARVVIRGANSIAGNNQPLFVVDGIPVSNQSPNYGGNRGYGGVDYGNAAGDINPDLIESVTVLKGPNAAALYGSRAANGAIVITTKRGRQGRSQLTVTQNVSRETPLRLPTYQNEYGQGSGGEFEFVDGAGGGTFDGFDESWGPRLDGTIRRQFFGEGPWVAHPNNVRDFFETGLTSNTNVQFSAGNERSDALISASHMNQNGMYPGMELKRTTVALNGSTSLSDRLRANASVQYINADGNNRPGVGYEGDNPMLQFVWFGRQVDTRMLRDRRRNESGGMFNWNYNYHSNPYWIALENTNFDTRDRVIGNVSSTYNFTDWLSATVRSGTDLYQDQRQRNFAAGTIGIYLQNGAVGNNGAFNTWDVFFQETNTDFLVRANREVASRIRVDASVGGNRRDQDTRSEYTEVLNLSAPDVFSLSNRAEDPYSDVYRTRKRVNSLYGQATFGYDDLFFVDVTGRNDWSSTLPAENNSYFYPSVSGSLILTDAFPSLDFGGALSFGKVRASWARVGNDADPYQLRSVYTSRDPFGGFATFEVPNTIANADLKPEQTESVELGAEFRFLRDRAGLEVTYYDAATTNQILTAPVSATSGYNFQVVNAGKVTNRGVEVQANLVPIRLANGLEWNITANYARNNNRVEELYGDIQTVVLGTYWGVTSEARKGERYGALYGTPYRRVTDRNSQFFGQPIIGASGVPLRGTSKEVLGHYTPDWIGSLRNELRFRGANLSFLLDTRQGGEIFSVTHMFGRYAGVLEETLQGRETPMVIPGVRVVDGDTVANTVEVDAETYWSGLYGLHEAHITDGSFVKLREVVLGYNVPNRMTRRLGVSGMNVSLVGRNLKLWTDTPHIDPETAFDASNAQGFEFGQFPSARSWGFNISVTP
jgi:TonB-linked SusC/RagA family outer membrane protein